MVKAPDTYQIVQKDELLQEINLFVRVKPQARTRSNSRPRRHYQDKSKNADLIYELSGVIPHCFDQPIYIEQHFFYNSKREWADSQRLGDIDNILKGAWDIMQAADIFKNDSKIVGTVATKNTTTLEDFVQFRIYSVKRGSTIEISHSTKTPSS